MRRQLTQSSGRAPQPANGGRQIGRAPLMERDTWDMMHFREHGQLGGERFIHRFVVNEHMDVAWDAAKERVRVLVDGEPILQCAFLVANVSPCADGIASIDDLAQASGARKLEGRSVRDLLSLEEEVHAHASNIQAWVEHDYDTRLLHSNISFPLLKALARAGDAKAKRVLDAELGERIRTGSDATRTAILETCGELLDAAAFETILEGHRPSERCELWYRRGNAFKDAGDAPGAIVAYRKAIAYDPDYRSAWIYLGIALDAVDDVPGAIDACRKVIALHPGDAWAWNNLSTYYVDSIGLEENLDKGQRKEILRDAIGAAERAIELDPQEAVFQITLGEALETSDDADGAAIAYRKAFSRDPEGLIETFRQAVAIKPSHALGWKGLSAAYTEVARRLAGADPGRKGKVLADAIAAARKAIKLAPGVGSYRATLGKALETSGDAGGAAAAYRKALELDPKNKTATDGLRRLGNAAK